MFPQCRDARSLRPLIINNLFSMIISDARAVRPYNLLIIIIQNLFGKIGDTHI